MSAARTMPPPRSIGVLICSYRRPDSLARGLGAVLAQQRRPDAITVVARETDRPTLELLERYNSGGIPLRIVRVGRPGTVHALNAGLDASHTDVIAITDDDTAPHPDWLARILAHFVADPALGGLGGRDRCHDGTGFDDRDRFVVGRLQWFGRIIGNHHLGAGPPQEVHVLKGANMSYRARAIAGIRFDERLRGQGAQPYEDITFSLAVRRAGWRLLYDPAVKVDHYSGKREEPRHYQGVLPVRDVEGYFDFAYNGVVALWEEMRGARRYTFLLWSMLVGTGVCPGLAQAIRYAPRLGLWPSWHRFLIAQRGIRAAWRALSAQESAAMAGLPANLPYAAPPTQGER